MENPSQSHYTTKELFMLKPEIIEDVVVNSELPADDSATVIPQKLIKKAFWPKYKWHIIGGGIGIIGGIIWFFYNEDQKKKKRAQKN